MKKNIYRKGAGDFLKSAILPIAFTIAVMAMIIFGLSETESSSRAEAVRILEDSIRRAVVMSYAVEGRYPDSISDIEKAYNIKYIETERNDMLDMYSSTFKYNETYIYIYTEKEGIITPSSIANIR